MGIMDLKPAIDMLVRLTSLPMETRLKISKTAEREGLSVQKYAVKLLVEASEDEDVSAWYNDEPEEPLDEPEKTLVDDNNKKLSFTPMFKPSLFR